MVFIRSGVLFLYWFFLLIAAHTLCALWGSREKNGSKIPNSASLGTGGREFKLSWWTHTVVGNLDLISLMEHSPALSICAQIFQEVKIKFKEIRQPFFIFFTFFLPPSARY